MRFTSSDSKASSIAALCAAASLLVQSTNAIALDLTSPDSIKAAALTAAQGMISWYTGNKPVSRYSIGRRLSKTSSLINPHRVVLRDYYRTPTTGGKEVQ